MHDPSDLDLQKTEPPPAPRLPPRRSAVAWIAALAVVVAAGAAAYFYFQRGRGSTPAAAGVPESTAPAGPDRPLGGAAEPIEVPPLDASDEVVRKLVSALSSHPRVAAWLATDGLIRNFAVVVENIASGRTPASHLDTLRPQGGFRTTERDDRVLVDPGTYDRYITLADAVASVDPDGAARLYATLKPRIEEAYRDLGHDEPFDRALERAIVALLRVPVVEGDVELVPQGVVYEFADARIAGLTAAQKQLARMGPRNIRLIQGRLRDIALALGIPPERLP